MSTERSGLAAINLHIYPTVNTFFFFEVVVPVNLVMEDADLLGDDGKQLPVRRSDLTVGENPGSIGWHTPCVISQLSGITQWRSSPVLLGRKRFEAAFISHR